MSTTGRRAWVVENLQPYDPVAARRSAAGVIAAFAVIDFVGTMVAPLGPWLTIGVGFVFPLLLLTWSAFLLRGRSAWLDRTLVVSPLLATVLVLVLDLATRDASPGGQIAYCAPVLYAASQLRVAGASLVLAAAVAAELVTVLVLLPPARALTDAVYVSVILVMITVLLTGAGIRQDRLRLRLERLAAVDPLTGLVTRRVFDEASHDALGRRPVGGTALVLVDIDHFKSVNDRYGHPVGDDALTHIADLLRGAVGAGDVLCRLGGDELAILLPGTTARGAQAVADRVVETVRSSPLRSGGQDIPLSVSAGVGHADGPQEQLRELYAAADASLYAAKRAGRGRSGAPVGAAGTPGRVPAQATRPERAVR
jgi:diguanylate cyclase (GGDEF)-like protein